MKTLRLVLLAVGGLFVGYLVTKIGPDELLASVRTLSWWLLVVVTFPFGLATILDALGWRFAFPRDQASLLTLYPVRLAGEAFNSATPTASVGGESVKTYLLHPRIPVSGAVASIIVDKTAVVLAQGVFLLVGLGLAWMFFALPRVLLQAMTALLLVEVVALSGFVLVQLRGIFGGSLRLLSRMGFTWGQRHADTLHGMDRLLATFYREHRARLGLSILCHFLAWILGSLEVYLILHFLGIPVSLTAAFVIDAFTAAIKFGAFLIPAGLGAVEGINVAVFVGLGLGAGLGLSVALIRRIRELAWIIAGLVLLAVLRTSVAPEAAA